MPFLASITNRHLKFIKMIPLHESIYSSIQLLGVYRSVNMSILTKIYQCIQLFKDATCCIYDVPGQVINCNLWGDILSPLFHGIITISICHLYTYILQPATNRQLSDNQLFSYQPAKHRYCNIQQMDNFQTTSQLAIFQLRIHNAIFNKKTSFRQPAIQLSFRYTYILQYLTKRQLSDNQLFTSLSGTHTYYNL